MRVTTGGHWLCGAAALCLAAALWGAASTVHANEPEQRRLELEAVERDLAAARAAEARLRAEIAALAGDQEQLSRALVENANRVRALEARVGAAELRIRTLDRDAAALTRSLETRRGLVVEVLAALQRMGRRPPPALIARPDDALAAVRGAMVLGAVVPELRGEIERLLADLTTLQEIRTGLAGEREKLGTDLAALAAENRRTELMIEERRTRRRETQSTLDAERRRLEELARRAETLSQLLARLEPANRPAPPARLGPVQSFAEARGRLSLPVTGQRIREFGAADGVGGQERGLSIATRAGAQVVAPADGTVMFAGRYRSYGHVLILAVGDGYHVLLAGMEVVSVDVGQFVLAGEPVGMMGRGPASAGSGTLPPQSAATVTPTEPVLYVEFRKDGTTIDPGPWWAPTSTERVRG